MSVTTSQSNLEMKNKSKMSSIQGLTTGDGLVNYVVQSSIQIFSASGAMFNRTSVYKLTKCLKILAST